MKAHGQLLLEVSDFKGRGSSKMTHELKRQNQNRLPFWVVQHSEQLS
jgi:hypothetical protein